MGVSIKRIAYFLPVNILTNRQLAREFKDWSASKIEDKTGIRQRHIAGENETALDLAFQAARRCLHGYDSKRIDFLILCTQSPEYYLPSGACILQERLGLKRDGLGAFDFNLGCSGFIYGLSLAKGLIETGSAKHILMVFADTYSKYIHPQDKSNRAIFGDAAAAVIIERSKKEGVLEFCLGTDGRGFSNLIVPGGGLRKRYDLRSREKADASGSIRTGNNLYMNGPDIFNFTIEAVPNLVKAVLKKNNVGLRDIDYIIFHQANKYILEYLREKIKIPPEKFHIDLLHTGNTVSASIPIALKDCLDKRRVGSGDKVMLVGFGVGYSWGGTLIQL
jgi:3-oxoacyl-[acyl-carrier-protein] synthase-3